MSDPTVKYNGRTYLLMWSGTTRFGDRAKLGFLAGDKTFWVDASQVDGIPHISNSEYVDDDLDRIVKAIDEDVSIDVDC